MLDLMSMHDMAMFIAQKLPTSPWVSTHAGLDLTSRHDIGTLTTSNSSIYLKVYPPWSSIK